MSTTISDALGVPPMPQPSSIYYDRHRREFLMKNTGKRWLPLVDSGIKRELKSRGLKSRPPEGETISEVDAALLDIINERDVDYCGPLAGWLEGFYEIPGLRLLVTDGLRLPDSLPGQFPTIDKILRSLLGDEQRQVFFGWARAYLKALHAGQWSQGQAVVLAGAAGCGKSFVQNCIITPLFGGRSAKAAAWLKGADFNSELFGAEHLILEDDSSAIDLKSRHAVAAAIKQVCVNRDQRYHAKHRPALTMNPRWRLSISVNDEPQRLAILPPLDCDVRDKLILLKCGPAEWPMPIDTADERAALVARVAGEIPHLSHHLLHEWRMPAGMEDQRYGVRSFHHPALVAALREIGPTGQLELILIRWLRHYQGTALDGTADEIRQTLLDFEGTRKDAAALLNYPSVVGRYLADLSKANGGGLVIERGRTAESREWRISLTG